jgi:hypothetical protein
VPPARCAGGASATDDLGVVLLRDLAHDGQAQAAAVDVGAQRAVERPEDQLALGRRDAGAGVLDLQHDHLAEGVGHTRAVTVPPGGVYCSALSTRLRTSSRSSTGCPSGARAGARRRGPS